MSNTSRMKVLLRVQRIECLFQFKYNTVFETDNSLSEIQPGTF